MAGPGLPTRPEKPCAAAASDQRHRMGAPRRSSAAAASDKLHQMRAAQAAAASDELHALPAPAAQAVQLCRASRRHTTRGPAAGGRETQAAAASDELHRMGAPRRGSAAAASDKLHQMRAAQAATASRGPAHLMAAGGRATQVPRPGLLVRPAPGPQSRSKRDWKPSACIWTAGGGPHRARKS